MGSFDISYFTSEFCKFVGDNGCVFCKFCHFSYDRKKTIPPMYSSAPGKSSLINQLPPIIQLSNGRTRSVTPSDSQILLDSSCSFGVVTLSTTVITTFGTYFVHSFA